jgi:hypothetical protein
MQHSALATTLTRLVGATFLLIGVLGFVPGITSNYDELSFASHDGASLLGIFDVNVIHNLVHLGFGVVGLAIAANAWAARMYLLAGGLVYLAVWLYGVVIDLSSSANFIALNTADNWLHLALGLGMLAMGVLVSRGPARRPLAA